MTKQVLSRIKLFCSPTIDAGDAHGDRGQSGRILWESQEGFVTEVIASAIAAAVEAERARIGAQLREKADEYEAKDRVHRTFGRRNQGAAALRVAADAIAARKAAE